MSAEKQPNPRIDDEALAWATRLDGSDLSPADLAVLDAWLATDPAHAWRLAHFQQFYAQLHGTLPAMAAAGALTPEPLRATSRWRRLRPWFAAAAAVALFAAGGAFWFLQPQRLATQAGHRQSLTLADGSLTDLNAQTRLTVALGRDLRRVRLERGEACFHVAKDPLRPFVVETAAGTVRVTGTVFDVRATAAGALEVAVLEGTVVVHSLAATGRQSPEPRSLAAGDFLQFNPATAALEISRPASIEDLFAWREGKVVFTGTPLRDALERFATYHGRKITVAPDIAALPVGGRYTLDELNDFTVSLERVLPVRVRREADGTLQVIAAPRARPTAP